MSLFNFRGKEVFYKVDGTGEPLVLLNGIMMSSKSWDFLVDDLSINHQLIRVDFLDQGQSSSYEEKYDQRLQIELVLELLQHLKIKEINLVGISYGGEIALMFSGLYPQMVKKLIIFNSVSYTTSLLSNLGKVWNDAAKNRLAKEYYDVTIPVIYSKDFVKNNPEWINNRKDYLINNVFNNPDFLDRMIRLTNSAEDYDCRNILSKVTMPTLIVGSEKDALTPLSHQQHLSGQLPNSQLVVIPNAGHASMYEEPLIFVSLILGFMLLKHTKYTF